MVDRLSEFDKRSEDYQRGADCGLRIGKIMLSKSRHAYQTGHVELKKDAKKKIADAFDRGFFFGYCEALRTQGA